MDGLRRVFHASSIGFSSNFLARKFTFIHLLGVSWSGALHLPPGKHITKMSSKKCQFCGEHLNANANFCTHCNHAQKSKAFTYARYLHLQVLRFSAMGVFFIVPFVALTFLTDLGGLSIVLIVGSIKFILGGAFIFYLGTFMLDTLPDELFTNIRMPQLLDRISHLQKVVVRNWIIFPLLTVFLIWGMVRLAETKPSQGDFTKFAKANISEKYSVSEAYKCPLFDCYLVVSGSGLKMYVGVWKRFVSVNPEHLALLSNH